MKNPNIIELLSKLVEIPSISSLDENQKDVLDSANYIADLFKGLGLNSKVTSSKLFAVEVLNQSESVRRVVPVIPLYPLVKA